MEVTVEEVAEEDHTEEGPHFMVVVAEVTEVGPQFTEVAADLEEAGPVTSPNFFLNGVMFAPFI